MVEGNNVKKLKETYDALNEGKMTFKEAMGSKGAIIDGIRSLANKRNGTVDAISL